MDYTAQRMRQRADTSSNILEDAEIKRYLNMIMAAALEGNYFIVIKNWLTTDQIKFFEDLGYKVLKEDPHSCNHGFFEHSMHSHGPYAHGYPCPEAEEKIFHGGHPGSFYRICWDT